MYKHYMNDVYFYPQEASSWFALASQNKNNRDQNL